jgi:PAS domain-containing protein
MSTTIKLRRSAVPGRIPTVGQLELGELALNTADGKIYFKKYDPVANTESIIDMSANLDANAILELLKGVDGANSGLDADLLDGQSGDYYLDYNNFTNVPPATLDLTLSGKVTGNAFSNTGIMTLFTELANTGVTAGTYGSASLVPVITIDEDGRITEANTVSVAGVSNTYWTTANNTFTIETADGGVYNTLIDEFTDITVNDLTANNIIVNGLVDGRDIAADGAKLDLLEDGLDLTLTGKVTGTAFSNNGIMTLDTELANTGVIAGTYGSATSVPVITIDEDGRITVANTSPVSGVEDFFFEDANNTITLETGDGTTYYARINKLDRIEEDLTVTLEGKVTGTVTSNTGVMTVQTELANTGVTAGTYGSSTSIPILTIDEDGRITVANTASVAGVEDFYWTSSNNTLILQTGDGTEYVVPIEEFNNITVNDLTANNIIVSGTVDGRDIAADGSKLDGIEAGATADQDAADIRALGFFDTTNDGDGSGLDADLLDGQHASDIIAAAVSEAGASVGNGRVTITGNTGLIGTGAFNLNDFSNTSITISHADTSSVANTSNTNGNVVTGITFDTFGHTQSVTSTNLDGRYYTETELDAGQLDNRYYTETELDAGQLDNRYYTETELNAGQLDNRYYTETEADARFVNASGDTMSGSLTVNADIIQKESKFISETQTTASTTQVAIYAFAHATFSAAEVLITATETNKKHITKLLVTHNGSTAIATEYGVVYTNTELADFDVSIAGPVLQILATPASSISTTFKIVATLIDA